MLPAAPPRFSTISDWPSDARMRSLRMRASTSAGPAAGNGTTIVIGRAGKACAAALRHADGRMAAPAAKGRTERRKRRRGRFTRVPPRNCCRAVVDRGARNRSFRLDALLVDELRPVPDFALKP